MSDSEYGSGDASYLAAGELAGLEKLVDAFYAAMSDQPSAQRIRKMHPDDLTESRKRLAWFLSGWLGGPRLYQESHGEIRLPMFHVQFDIGENEKQAWLDCMALAIEAQPYRADFKVYLLQQLSVPAERIRHVCAKRKPDQA